MPALWAHQNPCGLPNRRRPWAGNVRNVELSPLLHCDNNVKSPREHENEMANAKPPQAVNRPLSPHLQIYTPLINMVMSILHRITGAALYFGTLLLAWWLISVALGPQAYATFKSFATSWLGMLVLLGYTWALMHHMLGGLRHFIWDTGRGFDLATVDKLAWGTIIGSIILTA
ncbi:MAG: succinate dehydrogenase, cytochrome b556 subunit, partial [Pseudomonadota bacterium]